MSAPEESIVDFDAPPVAEVSLAVEFGAQVLDTAQILGNFWGPIRADYPKIQQQQPLPPMEQDFEVPTPTRMVFNFAGPDSRYWFVSLEGTEVIQVQSNRLAYNWRKLPPSEEYPRYGYVRERFERALTGLLGIAEERAVPTWCEISYVNPIFTTRVGEPRPDLSSILRRVAPVAFSSLPQIPINTALAERYLIKRDDGEPYAWFHVDAQAHVDEAQALGYQLQLLMGGKPLTTDAAGVLAFLDDGRERIVKTFQDLTTPEMHEMWKLS
jgi:uncharacterized protein (TIGR04255 family)